MIEQRDPGDENDCRCLPGHACHHGSFQGTDEINHTTRDARLDKVVDTQIQIQLSGDVMKKQFHCNMINTDVLEVEVFVLEADQTYLWVEAHSENYEDGSQVALNLEQATALRDFITECLEHVRDEEA